MQQLITDILSETSNIKPQVAKFFLHNYIALIFLIQYPIAYCRICSCFWLKICNSLGTLFDELMLNTCPL
ncbi:hypothetical protein T02_13216 [Trichinella nativa]|uniref:Uncharacterized protein n=1 Tax=Trichinella nativa TaxID=6335 RepID=A0A0V1L5U9_9BILA|nr:hypothetical protein T02_13216 [Trichinella nativa]